LAEITGAATSVADNNINARNLLEDLRMHLSPDCIRAQAARADAAPESDPTPDLVDLNI
jgi:hypothetical protein